MKLLLACALAGLAAAQGDLAGLLQSQPDLSTLLDLIVLTDLNSTLSSLTNVTIIAPTNAAFAAVDPNIPEGFALADRNVTSVTALLQNHVFQGYYPSSAISEVPIFAQTLLGPDIRNDIQPFTEYSDFQYNGLVEEDGEVRILSGELSVSDVIIADIQLGDGIIIHVVDSALLFCPAVLVYTARAGYTDFNAAITAAELDLNLGQEGSELETSNLTDFTIFIPDNAAFESIASVIDSADLSTLQAVLQYHILGDNVVFSSSLGNFTAPTVQEGSDLTFTVAADGSAWVNNAKIILPNVLLSNGVAHVIDSVLTPLVPFDRSQLQPSVPPASRVAFAAASSGSSLPFSSVSFSEEASVPYSTPTLLTTLPAVSTPSQSVTGSSQSRPTASYTGAAATRGLSQAIATGAAVVLAGGLLAV